MKTIYGLTAREMAQRVASGRMSCTSMVEACLERISDREPAVNAWASIDFEKLLREAREVDRTGPRPPLYGIPVGVKDIINTTGNPTEYGSAIYKGHTPASDASCVALIKEAGGVIAGKTVTTEFATRCPGKTANPFNVTHTPGGSSSGSAAAVADLMVPFALGTQTSGSHIRPASYCGVVGFKPTFGTINRGGVKPLSESLDTVGVYGRTVSDVALLAEVLTSRDFSGLNECLWSMRIGIYQTPHEEQVSEETRAAIDSAACAFSTAGHRVDRLRLDGPFQTIASTQETINDFESYRALAYERINYFHQLSEALKSKLNRAAKVSWEEYCCALESTRECMLRLDDVFRNYDILLAPSAPGEAPAGLDFTGDPIFSQIWQALHVPTVSVPVGEGPNKLPVGVQLIGRRFADQVLLLAARQLEQLVGRAVI